MKTLTKTISGFVFSTSLLLSMQAVNAAGFYLSEQGTPASVGTAGVANVTNTATADAAWTNPAGMTGMTEDSILTGLVVSTGKVEFDSSVADAGGSDGGNSLETGAIPSFFYTKVLNDKTRFGFSAVAPFGGGLDYGDDFVGRYAVQKVELAGFALTPSVAHQVNDELSVGFGVSFVNSTLEQDIAVRTLLLPGDGQAELSNLEDSGIQGIFGLNYKLSGDTLFGLVYRSEMDLELDGDLRIKDTALSDRKRDVKIEWTNPQTLEAGIRHQLNDRQTLAFNLGWQEWSKFSKSRFILTDSGLVDEDDRKWDDTWHAGAAYAERLDNGNVYTLGLAYESSPVKDKYRTFDFPVDEIWKLGGSYSWTDVNKFDYALVASLSMIGDAPVDQTEQGVQVKGDFDSYYTMFVGGTMRYTF
ncbi:MAG: outer membrane protein transport protein [Gammaproteobacteria bacterium]|jgi:long-chain fatty acid transport protein